MRAVASASSSSSIAADRRLPPARARGDGQFGQPAFEEAPFGAVVGEVPGPSIGVPRLVGPPEPAQEFGPGRVQVAEVVETESVDDAQAGLGTVGLGDRRWRGSARRRASRSAGRARRTATAICAQSHGTSACNEAIAACRTYGPRPPRASARSSSARPAAICSGVPARAVLVAEQHQLAVAEPRLAAGVVQEHHRQQSVHLRVVRQQLGERAAQPDGLGGQLVAAAVALVEDQVDDGEHGVETLAEQMGRRHPERDPPPP